MIARSTPARTLRLAAVAASPVFYQSPLYRLLAADPRVELTVLFASSAGVRPYDAAFGGRKVVWDSDLLGGYDARFARRADSNDVLGGFLALRDADVFREVARGDFDAVWVHGFSHLTLWFAMSAAWLRRRPVLLREEQTLLHPRPWPKRWLRALVLRALFSRTYGLFIGSNNRAYFRRFGMPEERLFFAPYCVDNHGLQQAAAALADSGQKLRRELGIAEDAGPVVLFVGKLEPKKQPLLLLEAFARVRGGRRCALLVVGEGALAPELRARARAVPDVYFTGFLNRSEIARAYAVADVFALPSALHETWGLVVNEAMNFSLPVVVSDKVGSASDLVRDGENGFVFPAGDSRALGAALDNLVSDAERRQRFGKRSKQIIDGWRYQQAAAGIVAACEAATCRRRPRLRVAFFSLLPTTNAATRAFCVRPVRDLARHGIKGRVFAPSGPAVHRVMDRPTSPLRLPLAALYWYGLALPRRLVQLLQALSYDVILVQRGLLRWKSPPVLEGVLRVIAGKLCGRSIVYLCDDALYSVARPAYADARFRWADWVVTGNAEIAARARQSNPNVFMLEGTIDTPRYPVKQHTVKARVVIGWVGHAAPEYVASLVPALRRLSRERDIVLHVVSDRPLVAPELGDVVLNEVWRPDREFSVFADFDIGVMPLTDTPFNRGKEGFKVKEYMAAGLPVVCSPVGHNVALVEDGVNGVLADTEDEWVEALRRLCDDPALRGRLGAEGRRTVEERFDASAQASRFAAFLFEITGSPGDPVADREAVEIG